MFDSYSHLSIAIFSPSQQPTTASHQHSGNVALRSSTMMPPSPKLTNYGTKIAEFRHSSKFHPRINFLWMSQSKGMFGFGFGIPTQTKESFLKNPKVHYFGLFNRCSRSSLSSHSTAFAFSTSKRPLISSQQRTLWELVVGLQPQQGLSGSVKHGRNQNLLSSSQSTKSSKGTSHLGRIWPNFVSS